LARQRAYDATVGRFTSVDPIGLAGGDNRFVYGNGDPLGHVDPEGLTAEPVMGGASAPGVRGAGSGGAWGLGSLGVVNSTPQGGGSGAGCTLPTVPGLPGDETTPADGSSTGGSTPGAEGEVDAGKAEYIDFTEPLHLFGWVKKALAGLAPSGSVRAAVGPGDEAGARAALATLAAGVDARTDGPGSKGYAGEDHGEPGASTRVKVLAG
jgi:uncharacterized protein RhaS with RHS repeats